MCRLNLPKANSEHHSVFHLGVLPPGFLRDIVVLMTSIDPTDSFTDEGITAAQKHTNGQLAERTLQVQIFIPSVNSQ